ncbi:MAG: right-handed parallel beta-helix repeat-containing protein [Deltaproteobacteria bacterium]|nr:right-handed parallel beta-helix repeat-containing protein [Deltaproteobacteria bacterium]
MTTINSRLMRRFWVVSMITTLFCSAGCALGPAPVKLVDSVISGSETWSGVVYVAGVVTVKKTGQLTIAPGTRVVFEPLDRDGDGIGDSELLVEGALLARGTDRQPIVFTSGAAQPQPSDWKYVYLDFAKTAEVDHVIAEYAYSGLQVHFCRARVTNSEFRHNVDGLRFSTVNLEAFGNRMHNNVHGLRYEERRSQVHLHHNDIRNNEIGVFVVTRSEDRAVIEYNNIVDNRQYNVKLGWQQPGDVTLPRNWWGTTDPAEIAGKIFDRRRDANLGQVLTPAPLTNPIDPLNW